MDKRWVIEFRITEPQAWDDAELDLAEQLRRVLADARIAIDVAAGLMTIAASNRGRGQQAWIVGRGSAFLAQLAKAFPSQADVPNRGRTRGHGRGSVYRNDALRVAHR